MKRKRALAIYVGLVALTCAYILYALRCYYLKPALELPEDLHDAPRMAIESWHEDAEDIRCPKMSRAGIIYALTHPHNPHSVRCVLEVNNKGIIVVSCDVEGDYVAFFVYENDRWKFNGSGYLDDMLKQFNFKK